MRRAVSLAILGITTSLLAACGGSDVSDHLRVDASINGTEIADATARSPLELDPSVESTLRLAISNDGDQPVELARVRLEGVLLGLNFLSYDVRVRTVIAPGEQRSLDVPLDFFDLERQASGYLRAHVRTYDTDGTRTSSNELAVDIRGSIWSTMSLFAYALLVLTVLSVAKNVADTMRNRLPPNRFYRGTRFAVSGLGLGLLLSVAFSVLRIFPLPAAGWIPLTLIPAVIAFALGYLVTPGAVDEDEAWDGDHEDDLDDDDLLASRLGTPEEQPT